MNARILFFTPGDKRICPWLRGNSAYDLKSASTSSISLSMHVVYASSNMSNAILCALVYPFHYVTLLTPHDTMAIRTVNTVISYWSYMQIFSLSLAHTSHWHIRMAEACVPGPSIATHGCRAFFVCLLTLVDGSDKPNSFCHITYLCWNLIGYKDRYQGHNLSTSQRG